TSNPAPAPTPGPNNVVVPLPQPATLPVGANPSTAQTTVAATTPALTPIALNQIILPPPTSPAPIVPATAAVGEGVKGEIPATTVPRNENFANPSAVASAQPMSSVIPVSPEAVAPAGGVLATATGLGIQNVLDKNAPNNSVILEANALLGFSNAANLAAGNTHTSSPAVISAAPGGNFNAVNLLSQISQQVSTQAAQAGSISHLSFQLMPESLGHLTVQVVLVDQSVSARIVVTNPEVRDTLQAHMVDLKSALNQAGLHIDQLQVQVQGGGGGNLLAQYYQYQQEGSGYRQPVPLAPTGTEGVLNLENTRDLAVSPSRMSLVDILA
ncbi:MAG TPA: flagellar hook-length control protein FliK, partial [bacterium]|nr:flagellar hook-length control protein FliK [bacterium]